MTYRRILPAVLACCAVLTACTGHSADGASGAAPSPSASAATGTPSATGPGPAGGGTSTTSEPTGAGTGTPSSAAPAPERCRTSDLRASLGPNHPGAGQENFALVLTNRSPRPCSLYGFPGVAFVNGAGEAVTPDPERATDQREQRVTLAPAADAWSALSYTDPAITGVTTVTPRTLLVTPPDETTSLPVPWTGGKVSNTGKASVPRVGPLSPGSGA
ncbi:MULTISPECIES: DUF4232 domain-containing protein [unclassified Streptomyces]|uniref:DUF4232 domain-containing protein n=1 Tax=unclassified Streptomyces TaxID=2593676 RepID=UPI0004C6FE59|nr:MULTISPECIES: DUF4232 domain-containing protein [unclassified Streptomyces]KOV74411.1 lipoprotein [Streptomyces sp. NRRL WC-3723]